MKIAYLIFIWLVLQNFASNSAQVPVDDRINGPEIQPFTELTLELTSPRLVVLALEPISLVVTQRNATLKPAFGYADFDFGSSPLSIFVKKRGAANRIAVETTALYTFTKSTNVAIALVQALKRKSF